MTDSTLVKELIRYKWNSRNISYRRIDPIVISASEQLSSQINISNLLNGYRREKVLIGVNADLYSPESRADARRYFDFDDSAVVVYFGAQNIDDRRKGFCYLIDALKLLSKTLSKQHAERLHLFTIGAGDPIRQHKLPFKHTHLPFISDQKVFCKTYAAADVFICPSVEDSGPMMINESMMSGTPVISFDVGVAKDLVVDGVSGYRIPDIGHEGLSTAVKKFLDMSAADRIKMAKNCRKIAMETCSMESQVRSFVRIAVKYAEP